MTLFGLSISRAKALPAGTQPVSYPSRGTGLLSSWFRVLESFAGAWQTNVEVRLQDVLSHPIVFACMSLIAADVGKIGGARLVAKDADGIWDETTSPAFSPFLRKPNAYQNRIQFYESWIFSKLSYGNTYVLLQRDKREVVIAGHILDPQLVTPLVAPNGDVYYELRRDDLTTQNLDVVVVPASEVIHDRMNTIYHKLVGIPPIYASGLAAVMGLKIINNSATLFANGSKPGGILTVAGDMTQEGAERLKRQWDENYSGENFGSLAVMANGMSYTPLAMTAVDAQLTEQLDYVSKLICSTFHVPAYKVGVGPMPLNNNVEALQQEYYEVALQTLLESIELCLDEALGIAGVTQGDGREYGTEFDTGNLLRMDTATLMKAIADGVRAGVLMPNEGRFQLNRKPVEGGNTPYLQHQDYSLAALAKRDASNDPFGTAPVPTPAAATPVQITQSAKEHESADAAEFALSLMTKVAEIDYAA